MDIKEQIAVEMDGIRYLKENNDMNDANVVFKVYKKLLEKNVFKTYVGYDYLKELREFLIMSGVDMSLLPDLPPASTYIGPERRVVIKDASGSADLEDASGSADLEVKKNTVQSKPTPVEIKKPKAEVKNSKIESKKTQKEDSVYKAKYQRAVMLNIVLVIVIIFMFVIAARESSKKKVDESKLADRYAAWEEELKERENLIRSSKTNE